MLKRRTWKEEKKEKNAAIWKLVDRAKGGEKEAQTILAGSPYHMRVYSEKEIEDFQDKPGN
ncbi:MAG: hypothetical protein O2954_21260 [bacterium]|nr:hypothetical protein [bacterium]